MSEFLILVIGKHAKTGLRVDQRLTALGHVTRSVSRSTSPAFDWNDVRTWRSALEGTRSAYVTYYSDLAVPTAEEAIRGFIDVAKASELQHLVLLSGRGEPGAERAEKLLMDSGLDWNVVRANWFMQNFSEDFMIEGILKGKLMLPAGDVREPFVDVDDITDVAVAALTRRELRNRLFEVSGPRAMTFAETVAEISQAVGQPIRFTPIDIEDFLGALREQAMPDDMLWLMRELFTVVLDSRNTEPVNGVQEALGRPATDFREYVQKVVASGAWQRSDRLQQA